MQHHPRQNAPCTIEQPSQQQSDEEGVGQLCRIAVCKSKQQGRDGDGYPVILNAVQQHTQDSTTKDDFLCQRCEDTHKEITHRVRHQSVEGALHPVRQFRHLFLQPYRWDDCAQTEDDAPEENTPGTCLQVIPRYRCPSGEGEYQYGDETECAACYNHHHGIRCERTINKGLCRFRECFPVSQQPDNPYHPAND